jgi:hypothetical protein
MKLRPGMRLAAVLLVAALVWLARQSVGAAPTASAPSAAPAESPQVRAGIGFRDGDHLRDHFGKHGAEFGGISEAEYLHLALTLRDRAPDGTVVLQSVRPDGVITRFDRSTGAFLAYDPDLTLRTFFRPNDGERYYTRQLDRVGSDR